MFLLQISTRPAWDNLWGSVSSAWPGLTAVLTFVGMLMVLIAVFGWIWQKRKGGGGGNHQGLLWTFLIGAILCAPSVLIPLLLTIVDFLLNTIINLAQRLAK